MLLPKFYIFDQRLPIQGPTKYKNMNSKILIDIERNGEPVIRIETKHLNLDKGESADVRDKLIQNFLDGGTFCLVSSDNMGRIRTLHSMNALDVLDNILNIYGQSMCTESLKEFEQAVFKVCSMIEEVTGERSSKFEDLAAAQSIVKG